MISGLAAGVLLWAGVAVPAVPPAPQGRECGAVDDEVPHATLGPAAAPIVVDAYLDPAAAGSLLAWLELRRLASDQQGVTRVNVWLVRTPGPFEPRADAVRTWALALQDPAAIVGAMRLVTREGEDRVFVRISNPDEHAPLAKDLGVAVDALPTRARLRCAHTKIVAATAAMHERHPATASGGFRLPVYAVDDSIFEGSPTLDRLRWELAKHGMRQREARDALPSAVPEPKAASDRMRRPPLRGVLLGGAGLPHRFVLMASDEDDPNLLMLLPPVLEFRRRRPAKLAVQVVARGATLGGQRLRHRLCAATKLGLELDYLRFLAIDPARRRDPSPLDAMLLERLDAVDEEACADEPDPAELGLPDGGWLDGIPRNHSELENIEATLRLLDAAAHPLSSLLNPPEDED